MNLRVLIALVVIVAGVCMAILMGGPFAHFVDFNSLAFVGGVTAGAALLAFPVSVIRQARDAWSSDGALSEDQARLADHVFRHIGRVAVASGLLGTVVGLVQMLQNLEDPSAIGPAMAVAFLTLFYAILLGGVLLPAMANECLVRGGLTSGDRSRRGSASIYMLMLAAFVLLFTFAIMLLAMGAGTCEEDGASEQVETEESSETEPVEAP